jgi:hypothetical protein
MGQNDELLWLWEASSALYPSIYLQVKDDFLGGGVGQDMTNS